MFEVLTLAKTHKLAKKITVVIYGSEYWKSVINLDVLAEKQIPLELNVTSNIRTGCCKSFDEHPVKMYFESGLMVTINSDDPPMFGSNLLEEYVLVQERFEFSLEQMRELAANSVEASFLPPERKLELLRRVEHYG